jgi:hypothetical protein
MAQAIIQQQPVDGDFNDAVDPESDISGDDSGMETDEDEDDTVQSCTCMRKWNPRRIGDRLV